MEVLTSSGVKSFRSLEGYRWEVVTNAGQAYDCDALMMAPGSSKAMWDGLKKLGHKIIEPVPSLFTFNIKDTRLKGLSGISIPHANIQIAASDLEVEGPRSLAYLTAGDSQGLVAPRLSAWGARELSDRFYRFPILINWLGRDEEEVLDLLSDELKDMAKVIENHAMFDIPLRLLEIYGEVAGIKSTATWGDISSKELKALCSELTKVPKPTIPARVPLRKSS